MNNIKKIVVGVTIIGVILIFVACGEKSMQISDTGKVTKAEFLNPINKVNKANIYYPKESDCLGIELNYDKGDTNKILQNFKENVNTIMAENSNSFEKYGGIKEIHFVLLYKGSTTNNSVEYKLEDNKFIESDANSSFETLDDYVKDKPISDPDINDSTENTINEDTHEDTTIPENGEFKIKNSDLESLSFNTTKLEYSKFQSVDGRINVDLLYNGELTKGMVLHVERIIQNLFKNNDIDLAISQKNPINRFEFKYENGEWKEK